MNIIDGFWVVVIGRELKGSKLNQRYMGVSRKPYFYFKKNIPKEIESEYEVLDLYTFDERFNNDYGFITTLEDAMLLLDMYRKVSKRKFEIIYLKHTVPNDKTSPDFPVEELGYDVGENMFPHWSILGDFNKNQVEFLDKLNKYGLFDNYMDAGKMMDDYIEKKLPEYDRGLVVWRVYRVIY